MTPDHLIEILDGPIAFHRVFSKVAGSAGGGIFLSQLHYWSKRSSNSDGWVYKKSEEWAEETTLSSDEIRGARKTLKNAGVIEEDRASYHFSHIHKFDQTLCFRIDYVKLLVAINLCKSHQNSPQTPATAECGKFPNRGSEIPKSRVGNSQFTNTKSTQRVHIESSSELESSLPIKNSTTTTFFKNEKQTILNGVRCLNDDDIKSLEKLISKKLATQEKIEELAEIFFSKNNGKEPLVSQLKEMLKDESEKKARAAKKHAEFLESKEKKEREGAESKLFADAKAGGKSVTDLLAEAARRLAAKAS